jgi:methyltransferase (TIGR00027 family)
MNLDSVSDTARWVAVYRALESERVDAVISDPFARKLAGERGFEIVRKIPQGMSGSWAVITRTVVFDEWISTLIQQEKISTVINLAAGLDSRPYRLKLPQDLTWLEIDFPTVLDYKTEVLKDEKPRCSLIKFPCDLGKANEREALMNRMASLPGNILLISEGLLVYLPPAAVEDLVRSIQQQNKIRFWMTDLSSPSGLALMNKKWGKDLARARSTMQFAPAEGEGFFKDRGWNIKDKKLNTQVGRLINREMKQAWFWRNIGFAFSSDYRRRLKDPTKLLLLAR